MARPRDARTRWLEDPDDIDARPQDGAAGRRAPAGRRRCAGPRADRRSHRRGHLQRWPRHRPPGRGGYRLLPDRERRRSGGSRRPDHRDARPGRLLRRAVRARWPTTDRPGPCPGRDHLSRPAHMGARGGHQRATIRRARATARPGRASSDADRSRPALIDPRDAFMTGTPDRASGASGQSGVSDAPGVSAVSGASGAPIGTVTCLFTDIEGSTRLEIELGPGPYRDIRERHRDLLRGAFEAHGGHEQGTEGDSFFVIFRGAIDAIRAAAEAQRAISAEPWPDGVAVRVRMGLHTGDIEATAADVIGYAINRTARIAAVAHGGQVLLSDETRVLVAGSLPEDITLRELGEHRLKDLRAPERIAQLVIEGVPDDFPPLRSLDARPNNLPTQLTTFVGRDKEL